MTREQWQAHRRQVGPHDISTCPECIERRHEIRNRPHQEILAMTHSQHTPGPWKVEEPLLRGMTASIVHHDSDTGKMSAAHYIVAHIDDVDGFAGSSQANARLIASAPDLAAEIERLKGANGELMEMLKTAIVAFDADDQTLAVNLMDSARALLTRLEETK